MSISACRPWRSVGATETVRNSTRIPQLDYSIAQAKPFISPIGVRLSILANRDNLVSRLLERDAWRDDRDCSALTRFNVQCSKVQGNHAAKESRSGSN